MEWKALNAIWKSCSIEQRVTLKSNFETLTQFIRSHVYQKRSVLDNVEAAYLNDLSNEARDFVISVINNGERNIYHSIMAILNNKPGMSEEALQKYYFKKYGEKRPYLLENASIVCEVISVCWHKFNNKRHSNR